MTARTRLLLVCAVVCMTVGCTLAEWQRVGEDAYEELPKAIEKVASSPSIETVVAVVVGVLGIVFRKSLARGFGRGYTAVKSLVVKEPPAE